MKQTEALFKTALAKCPDVNKSIQAYIMEMDSLKSRPSWEENSKKIYEENKKVIDRLELTKKRSWAKKVHFNAGLSTG